MVVLVAVTFLASPGAPAGTAFPQTVGEDDVFLDIGDHLSKPSLGFGWGRAERGASGHFRWIWRMEADLFFDIEQPRPAELWVTAAPMYLPYRRQVIAVYVNGAFLAEWRCPDGPAFTDYHAAVPARLVRGGRNTVTLRMGYRKRGGDDRELSLAVDRALLRFP
jgi:hypothetical protein